MVLDSSAFIGLDFPVLLKYQNVLFYTTPSVVRELKDFRSKSNLEVLKEIKKLTISIPESETVKNFKQALKHVDPDQNLSSTDSDILSLVKDLGGTLVSSDLVLQNAASLLGLKINNISGKIIKKQKIRNMKCNSCHKTFPRWYEACPECGGSLKGVFSVKSNR